jgi:predicted secreted hydrolase
VFGVSLHDVHGYPLGGIVTDPDSIKITAPVDHGVLRLTLDPLLFNRGTYMLSVNVQDPRVKKYYDVRRQAARIVVAGQRASGRDATGYSHYPHQWEQLR